MENKITVYLADNSEDKNLENYFNKSEKFELIGSSAIAEQVIKDVE